MTELQASLELARDGFRLDVDVRVPAAGVIGLFGPSGSGKTTLLRCLAGLERAAGAVRLGNDIWQDDTARIFVPPHKRAVGLVFQEADLFPHMSVRANLRYAAKRAPVERIGWNDAVAWLGLDPLLDRSPLALSGGERQRAAIGRALLSSPRLLLMDEPLAALDETSRGEIFPYLESLPRQFDVPIVYVSHSTQETARLADRLIWLVDGRVRATGETGALMATLDFARWRGEEAGVVVDAVVRSHDEEYGLSQLDGPWGPIWVRRQQYAPGQRVRVQIRANDVSLGLAPEHHSSILNQFRMRVAEVEEAGDADVLVRLVGDVADPAVGLLARITRRSRDHLGLAAGLTNNGAPAQPVVYARVKSVALLD